MWRSIALVCVAAVSLAVLVAVATDALGQEIPRESIKVLQGHTETAYDVEFAPSSKLLATASFDSTVKLWDTNDGALVATLSGHTGKVLAIAFSPDGSRLLSGSEDRTVRLWGVPGSGPQQVASLGDALTSLVASPKGDWLAAASKDGSIVVVQRGNGAEIVSARTADTFARALAFDAAQARLAAGCADGSVRLLALPVPKSPSVAAGASVALVSGDATWRYHKGTSAPAPEWRRADFDDSSWTSGAGGFGYSSNADELATVKTRLDDMSEKYLSLFVRTRFEIDDPARVTKLTLSVLIDDGYVAYLNGEEVGRGNIEGDSPGHTATATSATEPAVVTVDLTQHIAKLLKGANVLAIQGHNAGTTSSDFVLTPSLTAEVAPAEEKPAEDEIAPGAELARLSAGGPVGAVAFSRDGARVLAGRDSGEVVVFEARAGAEASATLTSDGGAVGGLTALAGSSVAAAYGNGSIVVWNAESGESQRTLTGHSGAVRGLDATADGALIVSAGSDGTVRLWKSADGAQVRALEGHGAAVTSVAFSAEGASVVSGSEDGTLRVWTTSDGGLVTSFKTEGTPAGVAAATDGTYYSAVAKDVAGWRVAVAGEIASMSGHQKLVHAVAFSPSGGTVASASADKTVRLWDAASGKELRSINAHDSSVYCLAFSPDGATLASGGYDKTVKLWNVADGAERGKLEGHEEGVFAVKYTPDGSRIISASSDHTLRVWGADGTHVATLTGHPGWIMDLAVLDGGARLVSADYGGTIMLWDVAEAKSTGSRRVAATVHGFGVSPDGALCATANSDGSVYLFATP